MKTRTSDDVKTPKEAISAVREASSGIHRAKAICNDAAMNALKICWRNGAKPMARARVSIFG